VKWPVAVIKQGLLKEYTLIESTENSELVREIKHQNKVLVKITYTSKHIVLQNMVEQYELVIEQLNDK
jgi:general stress protein 26